MDKFHLIKIVVDIVICLKATSIDYAYLTLVYHALTYNIVTDKLETRVDSYIITYNIFCKNYNSINNNSWRYRSLYNRK